MTKFLGVIAVMALLMSLAFALPVGDNAAEEVDNADLETAQQFYPGFYGGGFGGYGGGFGGGYYPHRHHHHGGYGYGGHSGSFESGSFERGGYFG